MAFARTAPGSVPFTDASHVIARSPVSSGSWNSSSLPAVAGTGALESCTRAGALAVGDGETVAAAGVALGEGITVGVGLDAIGEQPATTRVTSASAKDRSAGTGNKLACRGRLFTLRGIQCDVIRDADRVHQGAGGEKCGADVHREMEGVGGLIASGLRCRVRTARHVHRRIVVAEIRVGRVRPRKACGHP